MIKGKNTDEVMTKLAAADKLQRVMDYLNESRQHFAKPYEQRAIDIRHAMLILYAAIERAESA